MFPVFSHVQTGSYTEYNSINPLHIHRPFLGILPSDGIFKQLETSSAPSSFPFAQFAVMYFLRDRRTRQPDTELFTFSPRAPVSSLRLLSEEETALAVEVERGMMMYMRDIPLQGNPALIFDSITEVLVTHATVADDAFCFLMKQTDRQHAQASEKRGWELLCTSSRG